MQFRSRLCCISVVFLVVVFKQTAAVAEEKRFDFDFIDLRNDWNEDGDWDPPGVPGNDDDVLLANDIPNLSHFVRLTGNTAPVNSLALLGHVRLFTNGRRLNVDDGNNTGLVVIDGGPLGGAFLHIQPTIPDLPLAADVDNLTINERGLLLMEGGALEVDVLLDANDGRISGHGTIQFTGTTDPSRVLILDSTLTASGPDVGNTLTLQTLGRGALDLDGDSNSTVIEINDNSRLLVDGPLHDAFSGELHLAQLSTAEFVQPWSADGQINFTGDIGTIRGAELTFSGDINVSGGVAAQMDAPLLLEGANVSIGSGGTLKLLESATFRGGTYAGDGTIDATNRIVVSDNTTIGVNNFEFDDKIRIEPGVTLTIDSPNLNGVGNRVVDAAIEIDGGRLEITGGEWDLNGTIEVTDNVTISGGRININGTLSTGSFPLNVDAPIDLETGGLIGHTGLGNVNLNNTTRFLGGTIDGFVVNQNGDAIVSAATDLTDTPFYRVANGDGATSELTITHELTTGTLTVAGGVGSSGTVTVESSGKLTMEGSLYVGGSTTTAVGTAALTINNGSTENEIAGKLHVWPTGNFNMLGGDLTMRDLVMENGSSLNFAGGLITVDGGAANFGTTSLAISGSDRNNQPTLRLENGADAHVSEAWQIANKADNFGRTEVIGLGPENARSTLRNTNLGETADLVVGMTGSGELLVSAGGLADFRDDFIVGDQPGSLGMATVTGVDTSGQRSEILAVGNGTSSAVIVGHAGNGILRIEEGAMVQTSGDVVIAGAAGTGGDILIQGSQEGLSAELRAGNDLFLGGTASQPGGLGTFLVDDGGQVSVGGTTRIWPEGTLFLSGGGVRTINLEVTAGASLDQLQNGLLEIVGGTFSYGSSTLKLSGGTPSDFAHLRMTTDAKAAMPAVDFVVGDTGPGILQVLDGSTLTTGRVEIARNVGADFSVLSVTDTGSGFQADDVFVGGRKTASGGEADLLVAAGAATVVGTKIKVWDSGRMQVADGGTVRIGAGPTPSADSLLIGEGGSLDLSAQGRVVIGATSPSTIPAGHLRVDAGSTLQLDGGVLQAAVVDNFGTVQGEGTFEASLNSRGDLAPGDQTGLLTVEGNYIEHPNSSRLLIEIGGTSPGEFDAMHVTGTASLGGLIDLRLIETDGRIFVPTNNLFEVFTAGSTISGKFQNASEQSGRIAVQDDNGLTVGSFAYFYRIGGGNNFLLSDFEPDRFRTIWLGGDGNWSDANWEISPFDTSGATFPNDNGGNKYHALIEDGTVTLDRPITLTLLTLTGGTLTDDTGNDLDVNSLSWSGGTMDNGPTNGGGTTRVHSSGNIRGVTLNRELVNLGPQLSVSGDINGSGRLVNQGSIHFTSGDPTISTPLINAAGATIQVNSTSVNLTTEGRNEGAIRVAGGAILNVQAPFVADSRGEWTADGGLIHVHSDVHVVSHGEGRVAPGGNLHVDSDARFQAGSLIIEATGSAHVAAAGRLQAVDILQPQDSTIHSAGSIRLDGGRLQAAAFELTETGTLSGTGNIEANTSSSGKIIPGGSAGTLFFNGDLTLLTGSSLRMEMGGFAPGADPGYDQLIVTGAAIVDGTLDVQVIENFASSLDGSETFDLLVSGTPISGSFTNAPTGTRISVADENLNQAGTFLISYGSGMDPNHVVLSEFLLPLKTATWDGGDGNWSQSNWNFAPPEPNDPDFPNNSDMEIYNVVVDRPGTVTLDQDIEVHVLTIPNNGILQINADSTLTAARLNWDHQSRIDGGGTLIFGGGEISGRFGRELNSTLRNTGRLTWSEGQVGQHSSAGVLINTEGAQFDVSIMTANTTKLFGPITVINEAGGTIRRDGTGIADLGGQLDNAGLVQVDNGTLKVDRGTSTGDFVVNNGGTLLFEIEGIGPSHSISGSVRTELDAANPTDPAPIVSFRDGTAVVTGTYQVGNPNDPGTGTTVISGGQSDTRLDYNNVNEPAKTNLLDFQRGRLGGAGDFEVGTLRWGAARFDMSGTITVDGGEIYGVTNTTLERKLLATLINDGLLEWSADNIGHFNDPSGMLINRQGARFDITLTDGATLSPAIMVTNEPSATIRRNGSGVAFVHGQFDNAGLVQVDRGTLELDHGSSTGEFVVNNGGTLQFDVDGTATFLSSGSIRTTADPDNPLDPDPIISFADGTTIITGTYRADDANNPGTTIIQGGESDSRLDYNNVNEAATTSVLELARGALGGVGNFEAGRLIWRTGRFDGNGTTTVGGGEIRASSNINERRLNSQLNNTGLLDWSGGDIKSDGGSLVNVAGAEFAITTTNEFNSRLEIDVAVTNQFGATIRRTGVGNGIGLAIVDGPLDNTGTIIVENGTLQLSNLLQISPLGTLFAGTYEVHDTGILDMVGSEVTANQANVILRGPGSSFGRINALADNRGRFEIHEGRNFETLGDLANSGTLVVGDMSTLTVNGVYTQNGVDSQLDVHAGGLFQITQGGFQVQDGAALTGNGTIEAEGEIIIDQSGVLAPGASPGTIETSDLTFGDDAIYQWELAPEGSDRVVVNGTLTFGATATLELIDLGGSPDPLAEYVLFSYTPTASDPVDPLWMIDATAAPTWDVSAANIVVDAAGDRVMLTGLVVAEPCGPLGDFDCNGQLDTADIDRLSSQIRTAVFDPFFDVNDDRRMDADDRSTWVHDLKGTYFGDSNLDGEFNTADLVAVFQAGQYEDAIEGNSGWGTGDWSGDGDFTTTDLVIAFQDGGFEQGPRPAMNAVPEASSVLLLLSGVIGFAPRLRPARR